MLKHHIEIADFFKLKQQPNETEYDFRKKVFVKLFPEDAIEAIEMLFCVEHYTQLHERDTIFIVIARKSYDQEGEKGLWKFVNGFSVDPAKPYIKQIA